MDYKNDMFCKLVDILLLIYVEIKVIIIVVIVVIIVEFIEF